MNKILHSKAPPPVWLFHSANRFGAQFSSSSNMSHTLEARRSSPRTPDFYTGALWLSSRSLGILHKSPLSIPYSLFFSLLKVPQNSHPEPYFMISSAQDSAFHYVPWMTSLWDTQSLDLNVLCLLSSNISFVFPNFISCITYFFQSKYWWNCISFNLQWIQVKVCLCTLQAQCWTLILSSSDNIEGL